MTKEHCNMTIKFIHLKQDRTHGWDIFPISIWHLQVKISIYITQNQKSSMETKWNS